MDYNARYYSLVLGRFVSSDSIVPEPSSSGGFNRYRYARNSPLMYSDPTGHCEQIENEPDGLCLRHADDGTLRVVKGGSVFVNHIEVGLANYELSGDFRYMEMTAMHADSLFALRLSLDTVRSELGDPDAGVLSNAMLALEPNPGMAIFGAEALNRLYSNVKGVIQKPLLEGNSASTGNSTGSRLGEIPVYGKNWNNKKTAKTLGILELPGQGDVYLQSGYDGPSSNITGINHHLKSHVEAHAAGIMHLEGLNSATLYLNRKPCSGCSSNFEKWLPLGVDITVIAPNGYSRQFKGTGMSELR